MVIVNKTLKSIYYRQYGISNVLQASAFASWLICDHKIILLLEGLNLFAPYCAERIENLCLDEILKHFATLS